MGAENAFLDIAGAQIVVEIEAGLADSDDLRMNGQLDQLLWSERGVILCLVRVHTDRAPDSFVSFSNRQHLAELVEPGADRQHRRDPGRAGTRNDRLALCREIREI